MSLPYRLSDGFCKGYRSLCQVRLLPTIRLIFQKLFDKGISRLEQFKRHDFANLFHSIVERICLDRK